MAFLKNNMTTIELAEGVSQLLPPSDAEVRRCDELASMVAFDEGKDPQGLLHELFLLKAAMACEYAMGALQHLGMKEEGVRQFYEIYTARLAKGFAAVFSSMPGHAVATLKARLAAYDEAIHTPHPEDPHLNVADRFTRFAGSPDEPRLVDLCLETCKDLNRAFLAEIASLGKKP